MQEPDLVDRGAPGGPVIRARLLGLWHLSEAIWDRQSAVNGIKDLGKTGVYVAIGAMFTVTAFGGTPTAIDR